MPRSDIDWTQEELDSLSVMLKTSTGDDQVRTYVNQKLEEHGIDALTDDADLTAFIAGLVDAIDAQADTEDDMPQAPEITDAFHKRPAVFTTFSNGIKRPVADVAKEGLDVVVENNANFYHTQKRLGRISLDEHGHHYIQLLDNKAMYGYLCDTANFCSVHVRQTKKGTKITTTIDEPQMRYADNILSYQSHDDIRKLRGIYNHPVLTKDGQIDFSIGYNPESGIFIPESAHFEKEQMSVERAKFVLTELIEDFEFDTETAMLMAIALPLTMICRQYINDATPIFAFSGPSGAGKSLLVKALYRLVTGINVQEQQAPHTAAEWNKVIFARLLSGEQLIYFDNVNRKDERGEDVSLESNALASATTAGLFTDRILGESETQSIQTSSVFALSGIGVESHISQELIKRMVFILLSESDKAPNEFKFHPLLKHIDAQRATYMSALMTLIEDWIEAGKPEGTQYISRFETWASVIGGIFENAGIENAIPTAYQLTEIAKPRDIYVNFLLSKFGPAPTGKVSVAKITELWEKAVAEIESGNAEKVPHLSSKKRNQWMREAFTDVEYTTAYDGPGKTSKCWKGITIIS